MLQESFLFDFKIRKIESLKNMPLNIWLPFKSQAVWAVPYYIKWLPNNFQKKSLNLLAFALILKKVINVHSYSRRGQNPLRSKQG